MKPSIGRSTFRSLVVLAVMLALMVIPSTAFAAGPTLLTGLSDYEPGDTVTFSGSGFSWGEAVNLQAVGSSNGSQISSQATADIFGNINGSFVLPIMFEATYTLTATGAGSGLVATTSFYDQVEVTAFIPDSPSSPVTVSAGSTQSFVVLAKNQGNTPVPGVTVNWTASGGSMAPTSGTTGSDGKISSTYAAGSTSGSFGVTATAPGASPSGKDKVVSWAVTIPAPPDSTPPVISYTFTPSTPDGANGWYKSNVTLEWSVTDPESSFTKTGCVDQNITADQGATTYTCSASSAGGTSGPVSVTVKRDATPPTLTFGVPSPAANANGWNNTDVSISFNANDNLSGVATTNPATSPLVLSAEGSSVTGSVTVTDNAGNSATFTSTAVKIDKTAPTLTLTFTPNAPDGNNGWWKTPGGVPFAWTCSDATSDIDTTFGGGCPNPLTGTTTAQGTTNFADQVRDLAGNLSVAVSRDLKLDNVAPTITAQLTPASPASTGWYNSTTGAPTVSFTCSDATSGLAGPCPGNHTFGDGADQSYSQSVSDLAGNSASAGVQHINVDTAAPTLTLTFTPNAPDGNNGWWKTPGGVPFAWTCSDATSDIDTTFGGGCPNPLTGTTTAQGTTNFADQVRDLAGNLSVAVNRDLKLDNVAPSLNITGAASGNLNVCSKPSRPTFNPTDATSGIASQSDGWTTPTTPSGVGTYKYTATATDNAGNTATDTRTYNVTYGGAFSGYLQPINTDGSSRFKLGSTVPVKFQLICGTTPIANATVWLYVAQGDSVADPGVDEAISTAASTTGNLFRYDSTAQQYIFNLSTKLGYTNPDGTTISAFSQGTWTLKIKLDDGTWRSVNIQLPK